GASGGRLLVPRHDPLDLQMVPAGRQAQVGTDRARDAGPVLRRPRDREGEETGQGEGPAEEQGEGRVRPNLSVGAALCGRPGWVGRTCRRLAWAGRIYRRPGVAGRPHRAAPTWRFAGTKGSHWTAPARRESAMVKEFRA